MKKLTFLTAVISIQAMAITYTCDYSTSDNRPINPLLQKEFARGYDLLLKSKGFKASGTLSRKVIREKKNTEKLIEEFFDVCEQSGGEEGPTGGKRVATLIIERQRDMAGPYYSAKFALGFDKPQMFEIKTKKFVTGAGNL